MKGHYEKASVSSLDLELERALLSTSIHTDSLSVDVADFDPVTSSDGAEYFEPDFK